MGVVIQGGRGAQSLQGLHFLDLYIARQYRGWQGKFEFYYYQFLFILKFACELPWYGEQRSIYL